LLPVEYFHVVFTVPDPLLNALAAKNRHVFFSALLAAASETLLTLGQDENRLGALIGVTAVLHTWTRDLRFHPHVHCIVTGGGLSPDGTKWKRCKQDYLFPVSVLSSLFRGKMVAALDDAYRARTLDVRGLHGFGDGTDPHAWRRLKRRLYRTKWVSYAKRPFSGVASVYEYLGRYTHRVGISNHRLVSLSDEAVTFRTRGDATATLHPHEFLRRFLNHVLPDRFVKLRHYGLLAPGNVNGRLATARTLLEATNTNVAPLGPQSPSVPKPVAPEREQWFELLWRLTGIDPTSCQRCGGRIVSSAVDRPRYLDTS
jgi:hypothetical protein